MQLKLCAFILLLVGYSAAQDELDFMPRTSVDGLGVMQNDSLFYINFRFRMQNRIGVLTESIEDLSISEVEARVRRLRLRLDGFLLSPKFAYSIQLSFSRGDQDWDVSGFPNIVRDAVVFYFFSPETYISFGQSKLPGNRQRVISSGMQQFAERSIANASYNIDRDFGLTLHHNQYLGNMLVRLKGALTSGEGRNIVSSDNGLAYTGRIELLPLGEFTSDGDYFEGDLLREKSVKMALGSTLSYNHKAQRRGGQIGSFINQPTDLRTFILDGIIKYNGFSFLGEYFLRTATNYLVELTNGETTFVPGGTGGLIQFSYLFTNHLEIAGRYSRVNPVNEIKNFTQGGNEITLGLTKYFSGHRIKAQFNLMYLNDHILFSERADRWGATFQIEVGI